MYLCEVFDSDGTLAIQTITGQDVAHVVWTDRTTATDEDAEPTWRALTDQERDEILNLIVLALGRWKTMGES